MKGSSIKIVCLGAGQDVGKSCILISIGGKNVMLDSGMHMGYNDDRRFPDFRSDLRKVKLTPRLIVHGGRFRIPENFLLKPRSSAEKIQLKHEGFIHKDLFVATTT
uniref:Lactamase_B domain-containing protein n=1 Tax=Steinernema glaseri TaxID=37863 RepID=A0A1I7YFQ4_9BILA